VVLIIALPLFVILTHLINPPSGSWSDFFAHLHSNYIYNSIYLVLTVGALAVFFGVSTAWVVSNYNFVGRKFFVWGLILPLTIPSYIAAFTYAGIFDYAGPIQRFIRAQFGTQAAQDYYVDVMTIHWLIIILAAVLYPYVYVSAKAAFALQTTNYVEAGRSLGLSRSGAFFKISLPLARPAIFAGLFLVVMEVLNDYGAMDYFGVKTFTTEIFRFWPDRNDLNGAIKLAGILLVVVFLLITLERWQRGRAKFSGSSKPRPMQRQQLRGKKAFAAFALCALPFLIGFFIPVLQLISWSIDTAATTMDSSFFMLAWNSFLLAFIAVCIIVGLALLIVYAKRLNSGKLGNWLSRVAVIGYSIPGAIIAIGVMVPALYMNRSIVKFLNETLGTESTFVLTQTVIVILIAYVVRFLAVAFNPIEAGFEKLGPNLDDASRSLGVSPVKALFTVHFPLLKPAIIGAAILVFVDVLKELPLTIMLRPSNFGTLATEAYTLAKEEQVPEAANMALIIITAGIIPIFLLNKLLQRQRS
jgi:iron(III) transport system permease protein